MFAQYKQRVMVVRIMATSRRKWWAVAALAALRRRTSLSGCAACQHGGTYRGLARPLRRRIAGRGDVSRTRSRHLLFLKNAARKIKRLWWRGVNRAISVPVCKNSENACALVVSGCNRYVLYLRNFLCVSFRVRSGAAPHQNNETSTCAAAWTYGGTVSVAS